MKLEVKKNRFISPEPLVIVTCRDEKGRGNALTVGLAGNVSVDPEIIMIAIKKERFSYNIIQQQKEFVINIATKDQKDFIDYFGSYSGRVVDKLSCYNTMEAKEVNVPIIIDCPVNLECKVIKIVPMGSHEVFFAEVVKAHCDKEYLDSDGCINWQKLDPIHS